MLSTGPGCRVVGRHVEVLVELSNDAADEISAFQEHGARLYNHAVMMLPLHSLPMRAAASFNASACLRWM